MRVILRTCGSVEKSFKNWHFNLDELLFPLAQLTILYKVFLASDSKGIFCVTIEVKAFEDYFRPE